jgi:hypothetical protein
MAILRRTFTSTAALVLVASISVTGQPANAAGKVDLTKVQQATAAAPTMQFAMTLDMQMPLGGKKVAARISASGKADKPKKASQVEMDMSGFMKAIMGAQGGGQSAAMPFSPDDMKLSMIALDSKLYMKFGMLTAMSGTSAKPWTLIDAKAMGVDSGDVLASQGADPTQGLDFLAGLTSNAKEVGTEKLRGVSTTRIDSTIDLATLLKKTPADQQAQAKTMFGNKTMLPVSVWVDDQNRARRFDVTFEVVQQGQAIPAKTSYEFFGFGDPVSITAPPASQVGPNPMIEALIKEAATKKTASKATAPKKAA